MLSEEHYFYVEQKKKIKESKKTFNHKITKSHGLALKQIVFLHFQDELSFPT